MSGQVSRPQAASCEVTATGLTEQQQQVGMKYVYLAASTGSVMHMVMTGSAIATLFIKTLGGSDFQAMVPGSLAFMLMFLQIPVSMRVRPGNAKPFMLRCWSWSILLFILAVLSPLLIPSGKHLPLIVLMLFGVAQAVSTGGGTFWMPMLHDVVPVHRRGRFFGRLRAVWNSVGLVIILSGGFLLGDAPEVWQFQVIFGFALLLLLIRNNIVARIPAGNTLSGDLDYDDWKRYVRGLLREKPLLVFLGYYGALGFCMGFLSQPLVLYMKYRHIDAGNNVFIYSFTTMGMILTFLVAGVLVDRLGTKRVFLMTHLVLCGVCFFVVGMGQLANEWIKILMPFAMGASGGAMAASSVACTAQLFHLVPNRGRAFYLSLSFIITSAGLAVSPLLIGALVDIVSSQWSVSLFGLSWDIFQVCLSVAGVLMLVLIALLQLVQSVHPRAEATH